MVNVIRKADRMRRVLRTAGVGLGLCMAASGVAAAPADIPLPGKAVFPESLSIGADGRFYVGSINGGVLQIETNGKTRQWIAPGAYGTRSIFGVLADPAHGLLWVCSNDISAMGVAGPGKQSGSWLKGFDLKTGKGRVSARLPGEATLCNDMAVAKDGTVYVANTSAPQILRLSPGGSTLDVWLTDPRFQPGKGGGLDGIAFGGDGNLYVTTFVPGEMFRIGVKDGRAGAVTKLETSRPLQQADALRPIAGNSFALVEGAGRIDRVTIEGDKALIEPLRSGLAGPTGVDVRDGVAWFVQGQLSYVFDPAKRGQTPELPFRILAVPVK